MISNCIPIHMSIDFIDLTEKSKFLAKVSQYEVIRFENDRIEDDYYVVFKNEQHPTEPFIVVELWQFEGGYDHRFHRFLEQDAGLNVTVDVYTPKVYHVPVQEIISYRTESGLTDKEEFFFNITADSTQAQPDTKYRYPYELKVAINGNEEHIIATQWTPLQKIPVEKMQVGSVIEVWEIDEIYTMMKILQV